MEVQIKTVGHEVKITVIEGANVSKIGLPKEQAAALGDMLKMAARATAFEFSVKVG